jgi:chemotaxis receptor (MCP) glutamine deamidase CheD
MDGSISEEIIVSMGRYAIAYPPVTLGCVGLGSCIGLLLYDEKTSMAGMAHIMLPEYTVTKPPLKHTALIAHNNPKMFDVIKRAMEERDIYLHEVRKSLKNIRDEILKVNPDIVLIDSRIEVPDDLLAGLLADFRNIRFIITNLATDSDSISKLYEQGAFNVLFNPLTNTKVRIAVASALDYKMLKYANVTIGLMLSQMIAEGADKTHIKAKIAGGGHMFKTIIDSDIANIGLNNIKAVKKHLEQLGIPLIAESTGGSLGKTIRFICGHTELNVATQRWTSTI